MLDDDAEGLASQDNESPGKPRLLLIDDSKMMRKSAQKMLGKDFDVVVAEDGVVGWQKIVSDTDIQVVFTDLNMPNMDGYQLIAKIRTDADEGIRHLPVIVVTGADNDEEAKENALQAGATDFIGKPFNSTDLRARALAHANYQRTTRALQATARVDALTQLGNLRFFTDQLSKDISFVVRHKEDLAVMLVEIDLFNDLFLRIGRGAADNVVKQIARVLERSVRKEDSVARVSLARFALSLPTAKAYGAVDLAKRICQVVAGFKATLRGEAVQISVSAGVYVPERGSRPDFDSVYEGAQRALRVALSQGSNQVYAIVPAEDADTDDDTTPATTLSVLSVDKALLQLANGEHDAVQQKWPMLLNRLTPLFNSLTDAQKTELMARILPR